jgi:uncharacterized membrane protein required for colicin V production
MPWVDVIASLILIFSLIGGLIGGVVRGFFSLLTIIVAIPVTAAFYGYLASLLSFLPGQNWENFIGFLITMAIVSIVLSIVFWIPRHFLKAVWKSGLLSSLIGGVFTLINSAISLFIIALLIQTYPIITWLSDRVSESVVLSWLLVNLDFVRFFLLPAFNSTYAVY